MSRYDAFPSSVLETVRSLINLESEAHGKERHTLSSDVIVGDPHIDIPAGAYYNPVTGANGVQLGTYTKDFETHANMHWKLRRLQGPKVW
jgi:hypothetical protein